jgi:hypothetical protein
MFQIQVTESTYRALELAARLTGMTPGGVVDRLVAQSPAPSHQAQSVNDDEGSGVAVYADYAGHRVKGTFYPLTRRIDITSGSLSGGSYKSPSAAARAVVNSLKPGVNSNRNGWSFWLLADGTGDLQSIRHRG